MKNTDRILIVALIAISFALTGCKEESEDNAPAGLSISWTDYNTVDAVQKYFVCHPATLKSHAGDTIRVSGYCSTSISDMISHRHMYISNEPGGYIGSSIMVSLQISSTDFMDSLREMGVDRDKKVNIVGQVSYTTLPENGYMDDCCGYFLVVYPYEISI